jgi:hypothetical protein
MTRKKPFIVIALSSDTSVRSLVLSGALREISEQFEVIYLCSDKVSFELSNSIKIDFTKSRGHFIKLVDYYLWHLAFFKYLRRSGNNKKEFKSFKIAMLRKKEKALLAILSLPVIYEVIMPLIENLVIRYDKDIYNFLKKINPQMVIVPGVPFDSFGLEVMKCAQALSIRTIMTVIHWDLFSHKGLLRAEPDIVCTWGEQMSEMAIGRHKLSSKKVRIVGVPQFEIYRNKISVNDARKNLSLPLDKKILLFAGTGAPFDEMSILQEIDSLIGTALPSDTLVLYRPHPKKHQARKNEKDFEEYQFKNITLDPENVDGKKKSGETTLEYYANLLYSIDGLISPLSTMTVEAALCGKPCLAIAFSDDLHEWKFEYALSYEHLSPLQKFDRISLCKSRNNLKNCFIHLLKSIDEPDISEKIKKDIQFIVYSDDKSYSERLLDVVNENLPKNTK